VAHLWVIKFRDVDGPPFTDLSHDNVPLMHERLQPGINRLQHWQGVTSGRTRRLILQRIKWVGNSRHKFRTFERSRLWVPDIADVDTPVKLT